ncbi:RAD55 family ATPase [Halogranum rubrum]|uniref:RAD55 family ATPase n=1 Tax=Halogranum rubrum TaxID=553466 RepID=UPI0006779293|nr:hypothetical protein [Halogranum salarium]
MRLTTGIEILDRRLAGGIPAGHLVVLTSQPETQNELLFRELSEHRETLYISTIVPQAEIEELLDSATTTIEYAEPESLLKNPDRYLDQVTSESNVIIDPVNALESADRAEYLTFMNKLKEKLRETGSIGLVYCMEEQENPRQRSLTLKRSDVIWQLYLLVMPLTVETRLVISKFRGGSALREPVRLLLTDRVSIDTSQNIA